MQKKLLVSLGIIAMVALTGCAGLRQGLGQQTPVENPAPEKEIVSTGNGEVTSEVTGDKEIIETTGNTETKPSAIVKSGYEFTVPEDYGVAFSDDFGVYFYMNDIFQIRPVVVEEDKAKFDSYYDDASGLTEKSVNAGGVILHDPKVDTVDGLDIFHFRVDFDGEISEVMRCRISDTASLGGHMALLSDVSENDCLHIFASIAKTAVPSTGEDTTLATYIDANTNLVSGEEVTENTIGNATKSVKYNVTEGFYYNPKFDEEDEDKFEQSYGDGKFNFLLIKLLKDESGAQSYVSDRAGQSKVETMDVDGNTYYYYFKDESTDEYESYESIAATEVGDGYIYVVDFEAGYKYSVNDLIEFMQIKVK